MHARSMDYSSPVVDRDLMYEDKFCSSLKEKVRMNG